VPPGVLYVAVDGPGTRRVDRHELTGDREEVRAGACTLALELLLSAVRDADDADRAGRPGGRSEQPATADR
jgi:hypothetical protein